MKKNVAIEENLVSEALAGDKESYGQLYERYLDEIYQFIYYRVRSHQEAEDLTGLVFTKAWQALDENPPQQITFRLWLYRIARNAVIDHYRTRKEQVGLEEAMGIPETAEHPETLVVWRERVEELRDNLQSLNEDHQEVLTCRFVMGLSHAETAVVMSRSEQAVRALQYRAIAALRNLLTVEHVTSSFYQNGNGSNGSKNGKVTEITAGQKRPQEENKYV